MDNRFESVQSVRDGLKDVLISVLREDYDDASWSRALSRARKLHEQVMGVSHD